MTYDLEAIELICQQHGLKCARISEWELEVNIAPESVLVFANTEKGDDTYLGFRDVPWHSHGHLVLMTGESTYEEYGPSELLLNIISGKVVLVAQYVKGQLKDRWLAHRDERMDIRYIEPEEELRMYRVADPLELAESSALN